MTEQSLGKSKIAQFSGKRATREIQERIVQMVLFLAAFSSVATTIAIMYILVSESVHFFQHVSILEFLTSTEWSPLFDNPKYGILPLVSGTLTTTAVALLVAIPMGTIAAVYLSEFAAPQIREVVKPVLELLAGIPTIVYGYFALLVVTPLLQWLYSFIAAPLSDRFPDIFYSELSGFNMLSAGIVMGIMITPLISSISEDAMRAVPVELREGSYATGATRFQTAWRVVFPAALSGVSSAYILGVSRAVGETMIVAVAAGLQPILTFNPLEGAATITAFIVQVAIGDLEQGSLAYQTIFAAGLTLVLVTLLFNIIGYFLSQRYREKY
jgi:phosphate transport system permease protein